ncbi:phosphoribosylglycinamide formyltransferase [Coxiella burnetii]|uniref:phosphoribosylglycinamide formyltransferase n=1 Tax=Coxiella burnetii TaxID=777 RepID=UPI0000DAEB0F|nr:phosphoribosylglycinamide formyltransferase [Coxiella burnetii]ABX78572.1 phosphoribosylglycinamide formyltransferase [Coxiella burnetii RSA 331]AML48363.1 phosphoribosylglycinamide formyltransferase [Coxiella burnetii]AML54369.1 phosphoribosylglycinamide formyltransferase [Coxiella burnetii]ATN68333.1 phosphoribosylglycinamide formyltransferase [Coxiella burnetii]ATN70264.1 phosphoribosylglycinamide formyltransferase [Coxiella burnetii]
MNREPLPIVVLISGNGTNLQAIIGAIQKGLAIEIRAVISNRADAYGLKRAQQADIPTHIIPHEEFPSRTDFESTLQKTIDHYDPKLIVLAGFMRKLGKAFVSHYSGRMINIHPSLLPKYTGLNTHERALAAGETEHGVSVHYVTEDLDAGPLICQARLSITPQDTPETLKTRIHALEHIIYPEVLSWFAAGRLNYHNNQVFLDGKPLAKSGHAFP